MPLLGKDAKWRSLQKSGPTFDGSIQVLGHHNHHVSSEDPEDVVEEEKGEEDATVLNTEKEDS